jgi:hypothetical protein
MNLDIIHRYADLTPHQAIHLELGTHKGPMTAAFLRDGFVTKDRELTEPGHNILEQYRSFAAREEPVPAVIDFPPYTQLPPLRSPYHKLEPPHRRLLVGLARSPGLAYKWVCRIYGKKILNDLKNLGFIHGIDLRGAPQSLTAKAIQLIEEIL